MRVFICRRSGPLALQARDVLQAAGGYRIVGCISAKNADLAHMRASGADVFVLDGVMPYLDGQTAAKALAPLPCVVIAPVCQEPKQNEVLVENVQDVAAALNDLLSKQLPKATKGIVAQELTLLGFKPHTQGTRQLRAALEMVLRDDDTLGDVKGRIYAPIARSLGCSIASVERNIRYAIETAWVDGDLSALQERFGYTIQAEKGKPTNRAFLAQLSEHIRLHRA